ncbi:MAG: Asp-tRNA(Asn)/Glu-tRNA(Gln) amidotransferase subunit GatC [Patescibacteria group bacterium]
MAISKDEVKKLAELSRLELTDAEVEKMQHDIDAVISYVDTLQTVDLPEVPEGTIYFDEVNVMREDGDALPGDAFTDALLAQAPRRQGRFVKVKKILGS